MTSTSCTIMILLLLMTSWSSIAYTTTSTSNSTDHADECFDRSPYCRYVVSLCNSGAHRRIISNTCAKTCGLCDLPSESNSTITPSKPSVKVVDPIIRIANRAKAKANCTTDKVTKGRKCVYPDLPKLQKVSTTSEPSTVDSTMTSPRYETTTTTTTIEDILNTTTTTTNTTSNSTTTTPEVTSESETTTTTDNKSEEVEPIRTQILANVTIVRKDNETVEKVEIHISNSTRPRVKATPPPNDTLKTFANKKREQLSSSTSQTAPEGSTNSESLPTVTSTPSPSSYEYRKVKLEELMSTTDLKLPRITTETVDKFTVSLSKTLIKGTCYDEYVYCREFASLCVHPTFGDVMAAHCTLTCQRCDDVDQTSDSEESDDCQDISRECIQYIDVCHVKQYEELTKEYCPKTCGHCKPKCRDRHLNCKQYVDDDFCHDEAYTVDERRHLCGASCGMC